MPLSISQLTGQSKDEIWFPHNFSAFDFSLAFRAYKKIIAQYKFVIEHGNRNQKSKISNMSAGQNFQSEKTHLAHLEESREEGPELTADHQAYLLERHGTIDLDPIPSSDPADPYNWSGWKKTINLALVAFHACMGTFTAAGIIPAYEEISTHLGITLQQTSYLTSLQIAILGGAPLLWKPLSNRFGRRPIFLLSLLLSCVCNIGCAKSPDYASMAACRALVSFFISPAMAIGSAVVMETFFQHERARYMGIWTVMVTLGVPVGPFIFGFVAYRVGYEWIYWVLAIVSLPSS